MSRAASSPVREMNTAVLTLPLNGYFLWTAVLRYPDEMRRNSLESVGTEMFPDHSKDACDPSDERSNLSSFPPAGSLLSRVQTTKLGEEDWK